VELRLLGLRQHVEPQPKVFLIREAVHHRRDEYPSRGVGFGLTHEAEVMVIVVSPPVTAAEGMLGALNAGRRS
jgi:hypothetical protein